MRKLILFCAGIFVLNTHTTNAQVTIFSENFESGIPGTWTRQTDPSSNGWISGTSTSLSSEYWTIPAPASGTGIVAVNDDDCGMDCDAYDWLFTPTFSVTGYDSVRIYFKGFIHKIGAEEAFVGYSNDGSTNYNGAFLPATTGWNSWFITVPAADLTSTFKLGFFYNDDYEWGYGFALDDVQVIGYSASLAPANDNCATATTLTPNSTCTPTAGTITNATASGLAQACSGGTPTADVWYSFQATSTITTIAAQSTLATSANGFDLVLELYEGTCSGLTFLSCADADDITVAGATGFESINIDGLTIGNTYYIRVYNYFGTSATNGSFNICVVSNPTCSLTQPVGSIVENETCGAVTNNTCATGMNISCGDIIWGTYSASAGTRDLDFYKFTITNPTTVNLTIETEFPGAIILYNAANCASTVFMGGSYFDGCSPFTLTHNITTAGTYAVAVLPDAFFSPSCTGTNTNYILSYSATTTAPTLTAGGATTFCSGGNVQLTTTGSGTVQWYNGTTLIAGASGTTYTATTAGSYTSVVSDANGCPATSNAVSVTVTPLDNATFSYASSTICEGGANVTPSSVTTPGGTFSSTTGLIFADASTGEIDVQNSTAGTYTITYTTAGTCPNTATQTMTITSAPDATFTYAADEYCTSGTNPSPVLTGTAGVFTSTTGLSINGSTGAINLAASTAGSYTVTNTIAASGSCPASTETFDIEIFTAGNAAFTYPASTYCLSGTNPSPTVTGTTGTFSSTTGLAINAAGVVDLANSTAGTYTVTNEVAANGACPVATATASITVTANPSAAFTYAESTYCATGSANATVTGTAGTFTSTPAGLSINGTTGAIDLASSTDGTYTITNTIAATATCAQETATATVTVEEVPTATITLSGLTLTATETGVTYQWIDCAGNTPVAGATAQTFSPSAPGSYAVIITDGNCSTTSACQAVSNVGIEDKSIEMVTVYPNPTENTITISGLEVSNAVVTILDVNGRVLVVENTTATTLELSVRDFEAGVYFISVASETINGTKRFIKK